MSLLSISCSGVKKALDPKKKNTSEEWKKYKDKLKIMQETLKSASIEF